MNVIERDIYVTAIQQPPDRNITPAEMFLRVLSKNKTIKKSSWIATHIFSFFAEATFIIGWFPFWIAAKRHQWKRKREQENRFIDVRKCLDRKWRPYDDYPGSI